MCREAVGAIPGVAEIVVKMTANVRANVGKGVPQQQALPGVKNIIAVASGKGGVGKQHGFGEPRVRARRYGRQSRADGRRYLWPVDPDHHGRRRCGSLRLTPKKRCLIPD